MRLSIVFTFCFLLLACGSTELNRPQPSINKQERNSNEVGADPEKIIADIRKEFKRINTLSLDADTISLNCANDPGATVVYYLNNNKVVKIAIDWGTSGDYSITSDYYFKNDKLIFKYIVYVGSIGDDEETKTEQRTYVFNDSAIRYMEGKQILPCTGCRFSDSSEEYKRLKAYTTKKFTDAFCN
jgi:hypothetical protein